MKSKPRTILFALLFGCSTVLPAQIPHAVLVESSTEVTVADDGSYTHRERRSYKIADEHGAGYASLALTLGDDSRLTEFSAVCTDLTGKVIKRWGKKDIKTTQLSEELASDAMTYYMEYRPHQYPLMMSFDLTIRRTDGCLSYPPFMPQRGYGLEVAHASYQLSVPKRLECRVKKAHTDAEVTVTDEGNDRQLFRVEMNRLPAVEREPLMPPLSDLQPTVYFSPTSFTYGKTSGSLATWQTLGSWLSTLQQGRQTLPEALRQRLHELTDTCTSVRSRVNQVYRLLAQSTRYVSIQFGIGGLQPFAASDVYRTGFGDCKALSNYMVSMLAEVGVESRYVVVGTEHRHVFADYADVGRFNHVIVMVPQPSDTLWLECTHPQLPLGYVHSDIEGHDGLALTANGGQLVRLPEYADSLHQTRSTLTVGLQADGSATLSLRQHVSYRQYEHLLPMSVMSEAERRESIATLLHAGQLTIEQLDVTDHAPEGRAEMDIHCEARSASYASATGRRLFVNLSALHLPSSLSSQRGERRHDILVEAGFADSEEIIVRMPDGYEVEAMPMPMSVSSPYGTSHFSITSEGQELRFTHEWQVSRGTYPASKWSEIQAFLKSSMVPYAQKLVLRKKE